ncbi:beta strand repeat-containing protein [Spirosoma jeollabukense]
MLVSILSLQSVFATTFDCNDVSYRLQGNPSALYTVDLETGSASQLFSASTLGNRNMIALGYNPKDGFLYAYQSGTNKIIQIHNNGTVTEKVVSGLAVADYDGGDISKDGIFYLYNSGTTTMQKVNISTLTVSSLTLNNASSLEDFSISADGNYIYGIDTGTGRLVTYNTSTGVRTLTDVGIPAMTTSTYIDKSGNLFFINDANSTVYQVTGPNSSPDTESGVQISPSLNISISNTDGARCTNAFVPLQPTFSCSTFKSYLFQGDANADGGTLNSNTRVYEINIINGSSTQVHGQLIPSSTNSKTSVNNVGFNVTDSYLWGFRRGTNQLVRMGSDWSVQFFAIAGLPTDVPFNAGDIDANGILYLFRGHNNVSSSQVLRVDLKPSSATYLTLLPPLTLAPVDATREVIDLAINPVDGHLYGINATTGNLLRINSSTGAVSTVGATNIPIANPVANAFGACYFDNAGTLYVSQNASGKIYRIPKAATSATGIFVSNGPITDDNDGARCFQQPITELASLSGNIFDDGNALTDNLVNKSGAGSVVIDGTDIDDDVAGNQPIYATLVNSNGAAVTTVPVLSTGTYSFLAVSPGTYSVALSTNSNGSTTASLPTSWNNTGEKLGTGTGSDGTANGILTGISVSSNDIENANFGINKKPDVNDATVAAQPNPGGTNQAPVASTAFTGLDLEDGTYSANLTGRTVILTPATNATLYYNGTAVTASQTITSFDPTKVTLDPTATGATSAGNHPTFTYSAKDNAGVFATPATVTVPFNASVVSVSGNVFDDGNGLTDNTVNKFGANSIVINGTDIDPAVSGNQPIYVTLVNNSNVALATVQVSSIGTYTFNGVAPGTYSIVLSTNSNGSTTASLPASWTSVGEKLGTGTGSDGTANGILTGISVSSSITDANFGIDKKPVVNAITITAQLNPGGTAQAPVASTAFTGLDLEDGTYSANLTGRTVILTPATNATLYYNGTAVTASQTITSFDPTKVTLDPTATGATTGNSGAFPDPTFTYAVKDNANVFSDAKTVTVPFTLGVPDLTPILYVLPTTQYGTTNFTVVVDVYNLLPTASSGLITLYLTKDPLVKLSFSSGSTFVGAKIVQNSIWTFDDKNDDFYILKTTEVITEGGRKSFGLTGVLTPGNTKGTLTISTTIVGGSGGEVRINNNSDAEKIDYFNK